MLNFILASVSNNLDSSLFDINAIHFEAILHKYLIVLKPYIVFLPCISRHRLIICNYIVKHFGGPNIDVECDSDDNVIVNDEDDEILTKKR